MDYKRITGRNCQQQYRTEAYRRLAELEDEIESGELANRKQALKSFAKQCIENIKKNSQGVAGVQSYMRQMNADVKIIENTLSALIKEQK